jgi:Phosphate-induced protein 1 conserved region
LEPSPEDSAADADPLAHSPAAPRCHDHATGRLAAAEPDRAPAATPDAPVESPGSSNGGASPEESPAMSSMTRTLSLTLAAALIALPLSATVVRQHTDAKTSKGGGDMVPTGKGWGAAGGGVPSLRPKRGNGINYHNGPVMLNTVHVYYVWYGSWNSGSAEVPILEDLAGTIGGTPYFHINTTYYNGSNQHVSGNVTFQGATMTPAYLGNSLSDAQIKTVVSDAIAGGLPKDTNAVYFVLTSSDVTASSGFCTQYCGWHTHGTISGSDIKYSFVGNPLRCPSACQEQNVGPNGSSGADGMASIISHELEEAVTDPDLNAWYDNRGYENADKCAWTFGSTTTLPNGSHTNMSFGGRDWLIQQNWVNASGGYCAKSY